jgi:hypothetical protein
MHIDYADHAAPAQILNLYRILSGLLGHHDSMNCYEESFDETLPY